MFKKLIRIITLIAITGLLLFGAVNAAFAGRGTRQLTPIEIEGLLFMREEEKLARDVYIYMYELYGTSIFDNISHSEQHHMDALLTLINYYGLQDSASPYMGVFNNERLQNMYDGLIAWGNQSLEAALRVGGTIEEVDILDLERYLANTNKYNIQQVYGSLLNGSEHHLRAFASTLNNLFGVIYEPLYLTPERYQEIIAGGGGGGGGGGGCRRCGQP